MAKSFKRNGFNWIPKEERKKILLLSDDIRAFSGVGTMSREIVGGTAHHFNWVQLAGAIRKPDQLSEVDMSTEIDKLYDTSDSYVKLWPVSGYGDMHILRFLIEKEKPDAILHFTDPRFWVWLYQMEHEIRKEIPIFYYHVWDDLPYPWYNQHYYDSCDLIMNISKQTNNIVRTVRNNEITEDWQIEYVPHGINPDVFFPISEDHESYEEFLKFKDAILGKTDAKFVILYNNRNVRRKMPGDVVMAYKTFCDSLPKEEAEKCLLLFHTEPIDENGTDLPALVETLCPDYKVMFSNNKLDLKHINFLYNAVDVTINISSNEGFGLATAESLMAGKMIVINVTGGLQDQAGFVNEQGELIDFSLDFPSNHNGRYKEHGDWCVTVFPSTRSLQGSVPTPYIFDDRVDWQSAADAIREIYDLPAEERARLGLLGRQWMLSDDSMMSHEWMCKNMMTYMDRAFEMWQPRSRYELIKVESNKRKRATGILLNE